MSNNKNKTSKKIVIEIPKGRQRGKKFNDDIKELVLAEVVSGGNMSDVCKKYNLATSTVQTWITKSKDQDDDIAKLRNKRKQEFVENAWVIINKAQKVLNKELDDGVDGKEKLDIGKLTTVIGTMYDKQALANNEATEITKVKLEDFAE